MPPWTVRWELALLLERLACERIGSVLVDRDDTWAGRRRGPERLPEAALSGVGIPLRTQPKVKGHNGNPPERQEVSSMALD